MAGLSLLDAELLAQDLPELAQVSVTSPIYEGQRGVVEYRAAGSGGNPVVLMLHGLGSSSAGYRAQFAGLSREFRVVAWNAPGFGGSSPVAGRDARIEDYADALEVLVLALRVKRISVLVGSSWGSVVALAFARRYPSLLGSLVLSAPNAARGHLVGEARDAELAAWLSTADTTIPVSRAAIADRLLTPDTPSPVRQHIEPLRDAMTTDGWHQAIRSLFTIYTPDVISEVRCPIAILSGTRDQVAPRRDHADRLLAAAPWATWHSFEDCGHMLKLEAPATFNSIVRQMVAQTQTQTPAAIGA
ncbi:alpha/beta hydrolase (plasmid) [Bradyrhizobium sp. CB82]|uniref:alpha/beta fold hydrolase n=1 Tax=Bradyrhizobium sp. CB82 TaxID=3039159 RepID=UPI0024B1E6E1|nr:alpha/beta hydrolase [Bradyrhizobium sp. CB82]WFU45648.1 alpha/beta hydrolase [Bradyrhizobium sp. CB82]